MYLINCETSFNLTWSVDFVICEADRVIAFVITDTELYIPVVTFSTRDNAKWLQKLKSRFKRTISWNKYQSEVTTQVQNQYLEYSIDQGFQGVNIPFVLSFKSEADGIGDTGYYLQNVEIKDCNIMIEKAFSISLLEMM